MKRIISIYVLLLMQTIAAQSIFLRKVIKTNDNADKFLYRMDAENNKSELLGEVEIVGFSTNDADVFSQIYKKAKQIGGNTFSLKPFENIDGTKQELDPSHYILNIYYTPKNEIIKEENNLYVFSSSTKPQKIYINDELFVLTDRSYLKKEIISDNTYILSSKKILGSSIKFSGIKSMESKYFQIMGFKIRPNGAGVNLNSFDIAALDSSYSNFLAMIYHKIN